VTERGSARRPTWGARFRDLVLVLAAFAIGAGALVGYTTYRIWEVGQHDNRRHVDAIVVLGAAQYNGRPTAVLAARLDHAIDLYNQGYAPYLVMTGGKMAGDRTTEAATGRDYARARGVPESAILAEDEGRTTRESIHNVRVLFDAHGLRTALFVSDRSHMLRVLRLAEDEGIEAWGSPTETSPADSDPDLRNESIIHELGGLAYYFFIDRSAASASPSPASPSPAATPSSVP
jgi:uncharacterized SAM-binding protein YcdF (DUF218 family)